AKGEELAYLETMKDHITRKFWGDWYKRGVRVCTVALDWEINRVLGSVLDGDNQRKISKKS
ncbi:unnamed protein product, partial [marine sediment metagenome]